jgi:peptidoglycan/xylan/chitin deacetylase (PgdA/CDA1 family)
MKKVLIPIFTAFLVLVSCTQTGLGSTSSGYGDLSPKNADLDSSIVATSDDIAFVKAYLAGKFRSIQAKSVVEGVDIVPVAILMYHHITAGEEQDEYTRSVAQFEGDLQYLRDAGIVVIGFDDLRKIQEGKMTPPAARMAIISMDDGYKSQIELAVPLLKQYGCKASFSIASSYIGDSGFMDWNDITRLADYRTSTEVPLFTIISHTVTHQSLLNGSDWTDEESLVKYITYLKRQLLQSKRAIESRIAPNTYIDAPMILSLPYGAGSGRSEIISMAMRTGYSGIRTSDYGDYRQGEYSGVLDAFTDDPYQLPSLPVFNYTDINVLSDYFAYLPTRLGFPAK